MDAYLKSVNWTFVEAMAKRAEKSQRITLDEFEGLIDQFTIIEHGRNVLTLEADDARRRFQRVCARLADGTEMGAVAGSRLIRREGRDVEFIAATSCSLLFSVSAAPVLQVSAAPVPQSPQSRTVIEC